MEMIALFKSTAALAFVLALVGLTSLVLRRFGAERIIRSEIQKTNPQVAMLGKAAFTKQGKRLGITDMMALDPRRRLVLIRRDDVEHLVLIAPDHELVIEGGIRTQDKKPQDKKREKKR
ncbi:MAG: hypothetical protein EB060_02810 [Proteobacteria bacterium]|nr:hypothetical protein [Pseudomonadota bacterium]